MSVRILGWMIIAGGVVTGVVMPIAAVATALVGAPAGWHDLFLEMTLRGAPVAFISMCIGVFMSAVPDMKSVIRTNYGRVVPDAAYVPAAVEKKPRMSRPSLGGLFDGFAPRRSKDLEE